MIIHERSIRIGIPLGSLNMPDITEYANYGHVLELLKMAEFKMRNCEPGREGRDNHGEKHQPIFAEGEPDIEFYCAKPRGLAEFLGDRIDLAIIGRDTMQDFFSSEWQTQEWKNHRKNTGKSKSQLWQEYLRDNVLANFEKKTPSSEIRGSVFSDVLDLGLGRATVRWGIKGYKIPEGFTKEQTDNVKIEELLKGVTGNENISIVTAYPWLTYGELCKSIDEDRIIIANSGTAKKRLMTNPPKRAWIIYDSSKKTERMTEERSGRNLIVDCVVSGASFAGNNITAIGDPLSVSTAHLYMNPAYEPSRRRDGKSDINLKRLDEIIQRLANARTEYAKIHPDSIEYPGKPAEEIR